MTVGCFIYAAAEIIFLNSSSDIFCAKATVWPRWYDVIFLYSFLKYKQKLFSINVNDNPVCCYQNSSYLIRVCKLFCTKYCSLRIWKNAEWCAWLDYLLTNIRLRRLKKQKTIIQAKYCMKTEKQATVQRACRSSLAWM